MKRKKSNGLSTDHVHVRLFGSVGRTNYPGIFDLVLHTPDNYMGE